MDDRRDDYYQPWLRDKDGSLRPMAPPPPTDEGIAKPRESAPIGLDISNYAPPPEDEVPLPRAQGQRVAADAAALTRTAAKGARSAAGRFADWTIGLGERIDMPSRVAALDLGGKARGTAAAISAAMRKGARTGADIGGKAASASGEGLRKGWQAAALGERIATAGQAVRDAGGALTRGAQDALAQATEAGKKAGSATGSAIKAQIRPDAPPPPPSGLEKLIAQETDAAPAPRPARSAPSLPLFADQDVPAQLPPEAGAMPPATATLDPAPIPAPVDTDAKTAPKAALPPLLAGAPLAPQPQQPGGRAAPTAPAAAPPRPPIDWGTHLTWLRALPEQRPWLVIALASLLVGTLGYWIGSRFGGAGTVDAKAEAIGPAVRAYIMANPEIIREAIQADQANQTAAAVDAVRSDLETPYAGAWMGNEDGDVTMVVFTDYACVFCRKSLPDIERLLREDKALKVVFREIPILSPASVDAARAALVAARQGKYHSFHNALFALGTIDKAGIAAAAKKSGVTLDNGALTSKAIDAELSKNLALAQQLGFEGTPSWVIGRNQLSGAVGYDQLKAAIASARGADNG
jgi:protein-disulfide isomerase